MVVPSGADFDTASLAIRPVAPTFCSTTTGCFSRSDELLAEEAADDVGAAAGGEADVETDRLVLRKRNARNTRQQKQKRGASSCGMGVDCQAVICQPFAPLIQTLV